MRKLFTLIASVGLMIVGCSSVPGTHTECYIGFLNKTGHEVDEASVYSSGKPWGLPDHMVVCGESTQGPWTLSMSPEVEMRITDRGMRKSVMVSIKDVPKHFQDGTIYFLFNRDGSVQAKALREGDDAGYDELIKGLVPEGEYRLGFGNKTGHDVEAISVNAGSAKLLDHPVLFGGAFTESGYLDPPIPPETELQWTQDGAPHSIKVKLADVPNGFDGIIYLVAKADGSVEIHPIKKGDQKALNELLK